MLLHTQGFYRCLQVTVPVVVTVQIPVDWLAEPPLGQVQEPEVTVEV